MQQTITAKLQILVSPSDKQILCDTMKAYSDACNYVSEYIYKTHNLSRVRLHKRDKLCNRASEIPPSAYSSVFSAQFQ